MQMRLKLFHEAKAPLANGHRRDTLLLLSDEEFENNHGFIQWAFPTPTPSKNPTDAPVLDLGSAIYLSEDKDFVIFIENMTARFLEFLKRNDHWKRKYNHNHLRISRALESIRILHSYELSDWFLKIVLQFSEEAHGMMSDTHRHWQSHISQSHDRVAGAFVGLAIGDAMGAPVEFCSRGTFVPVTHYRSGGKFQLPAGAWTDDTAMALGLAQSLILEKGFEPRSVLQNFSDWMEHGHYTSTGTCVGVGQNTLRTLGDFRRTGALRAVPFGKKNDGNGSLMRLAPIPCFYTSDDELVMNIAREQSLITHASEIAAEACQFLALLLSYLIRGEDYIVAKRRTLEKEWSYPLLSSVDLDYKGFSDAGIKSGGYVLETLQAAIWAVENGTDFKSIVLNAVNLGDDADTTAAVAGQIAGAIYGYAGAERDLKTDLLKERELYVTSQFLGNQTNEK